MFSLPNLPAPIAREAYADLCRLLPDYPGDTEDTRAHRAAVAMAGLADLYPADAFQARLAAQVIAADAHATASLAQARQHRDDFDKRRQSLAQADSMMRQMKSFYRTLRQDQAQCRRPGPSAGTLILEAWRRDCAEPQAAAPGSAEPAEAQPAAPPDRAPAAPVLLPAAADPAVASQAADAAPVATCTERTTPHPIPPPQGGREESAGPASRPDAGPATPSDVLEQAEEYLVDNPLAACLIRLEGGLTARVRSHLPAARLPADPAVVEALVHGDSALLREIETWEELVVAAEDAQRLAA